MPHALIGKWRINGMADFAPADVDLCGPAFISFGADGRGEFSFVACMGTFEYGLSKTMADFDWDGSDEMDEVSGDGWAELCDDGSIAGEICYAQGDDWAFTAVRWAEADG
jgi:hypothetical protein